MQVLQIHATEITGNAPDEIMLLPASPVVGRDGRSFSWSFETVALGWQKHGQDLPIDKDHRSEIGGTTEAVGWIKSIFIKDNSLFAKIEWTKGGKELVSQKVYRYISPAFFVNEFNEVQFLTSAALTNRPNLKIPSLNNRGNQNNKESNKNMDKQLLNKALGLDENADFTVALNTVIKLKEQAVDINKFVPKQDYTVVLQAKEELEAKLNKIEHETLQKEANFVIDEAVKNGQIAEDSRGFYLNLCTDNEKLNTVREHLKVKQKLTEDIHTNKTKQSTAQMHSLTAEEIRLGKKMGHSEEDLIKAKEAIKKAEEFNK